MATWMEEHKPVYNEDRVHDSITHLIQLEFLVVLQFSLYLFPFIFIFLR